MRCQNCGEEIEESLEVCPKCHSGMRLTYDPVEGNWRLIAEDARVALQRSAEFYTPREVVKAMVEILDPVGGDDVYDPCCGSGGMLIESHYVASKGKDPRKCFLYGQERHVDIWRIAKTNVMLHDMEADIRSGDTLVCPQFLDGAGLKKFDIVLANPNWKQQGYRELMQNDRFGRFKYGIPPDRSADWGWVQHMLASLREARGRMGIALDQGALSRGGAEGEIRKRVVEEDLVECVVALPEKIFYRTGPPGCLVFLNKNKSDERKGKTLFIYAGKDFEKVKYMNRLREGDIAKIVGAFRRFQDIPEYAKVVTLESIKENDYNLSMPLDLKSVMEVEEKRRKADNLMTRLLEDAEVQNLFMRKLRDLDLSNQF